MSARDADVAAAEDGHTPQAERPPMKPSPHSPPIRVGLVSLGCAKNLVDSEIMLGALLEAGMEIVNDPAAADVLVVNTCSFIDAAQEESVDVILESGAVHNARRRRQALVVAGCLTQRYRDELPKLLPEVDAFLGIDQVTQVPAIVREALARRRQRPPAKAPAPTQPKSARSRTPARRPAPAPAPAEPPPAPIHVHRRPTYVPDYATPRFRLTPPHFAYVKIAEGCNHPCSFCTIPRMRGRHRSRPQPDIVEEVRRWLDDGVREINLISQDSTYYGLDLRPQPAGSIASPDRFQAAARALPDRTPTLSTLLRELEALPGDFWVRLLYTHPAHWTDDLIRTMAECSKVARYVDLPLQHIHENLLHRMRRETSRQHIVDLIARLRAGIPRVALRTTFIVGFPGETEACFESLLDFIRETRFERLGVFTYSQEEGTLAARMAGQVPERVRQQRRDRAMAEQLRVARAVAAAAVGRTCNVLVERPARPEDLPSAMARSWEHGLSRARPSPRERMRGSWYVARSESDAPDIDGRVYVRGFLPEGQFARVRIVGHRDYDLVAEPVAPKLPLAKTKSPS